MQADAEALLNAPLFSGLNRELLSQALLHGRPRSFAIAEPLMRQGETADSMHVILRGRVRVVRHAANGDAVMLAELGPGEGVGEMGLIDAGLRAATVVAIEPTNTIELDAKAFAKLAHGFPHFYGLLARVLSRRLRRTNRLQRASPADDPAALPTPLEDVPPKAIEQLLWIGTTRTFTAGEALLREGEPSSSLFFILTGLVSVEHSQPHVAEPLTLAVLGPGEFVGEMGVVESGPRSATVTAIKDTKAIEIDTDTAVATLASEPSLSEQLSRVLSRRLRRTNEVVENA